MCAGHDKHWLRSQVHVCNADMSSCSKATVLLVIASRQVDDRQKQIMSNGLQQWPDALNHETNRPE